MEVNVKKCKYMCFSRLSSTSGFYITNGAVLQLVNSFNNLGIVFDCKLGFRNHITSTVIKRWTKEFFDPYVIKQLFATLVRPIHEYGPVI